MAESRRFAFRHFRTRLLVIILALVLVLQALVFVAAGLAARRNAVRASEEALQVTLASLRETMTARESNLRKYARLLSHDFAFKALVSEADHDTLISAFTSYRLRLKADWMFVLDLDGKVLADTLAPDMLQVPFNEQRMVRAVGDSPTQEISRIQVVGERAFQVVMVPLMAPNPTAWVGVGFEITDSLADELERQTHTRVNLAWRAGGAPQMLLASTLAGAERNDFLAAPSTVNGASHIARLGDTDYVAIEQALADDGDGVLVAALQRSLDDALADFYALRWQLLALAALSTALAAGAAVLIARRVTQPVLALAAGAGRISDGHYETIGDIGAQDEFGELATAFDKMVRGLIERDKVRAMLGKVVSPAIAEELLSQQMDFGGREQEVSVLFSDIRGFTTLCEGRSPSAILAMLNDYLSTVSDVIDARGGVVDKYIGDAVMALFGAPLTAADDPQRAVETALHMVASLPPLNARFGSDGWPPLAIGIGIHTGVAVAGNIGSATRLNYTVLGDTVNLASRLEGLCKQYGVAIVVSDATMARCSGIVFRELDLVRVKGKRETVAIFEAIGFEHAIDERMREALARYRSALAAYRDRRFAEAMNLFAVLADDPVVVIYRQRCAQYLDAPPAANWDAVETMTGK
jgi:adenylate cyclase